MRAVTVRPGTSDSLQVTDVKDPTPGPGELLVSGLSIGVCGTDKEIVAGNYGWAPPGRDRLVLGHESLGRVEHAPDSSEFSEGDLVVGDYPVSGGPVALVGVAEKGYATLRVTAKSAGGHSSMPPKDTGVITLSRALIAIAAHPAPLRLGGPTEQMLQAIAPRASPVVKVAAANTWLFRPLLTSVIAASPAGAAMLHTTIAPTMLEGSPKENVLPQAASGWINYRIAPGDTSAAVISRAKAAVGALPVALEWISPPREPSPVSSTASQGWKLVAAVAANVTRAPVAPGLVVAGTDSRSLQIVSHDVYRFQPLVLCMGEVEMIHGTNEHMTLANLALMTGFYARLVATAAG